MKLLATVLLVLLFSGSAYTQELADGREIVLFNSKLSSLSASQKSGFISIFGNADSRSHVRTLGLNRIPAGFISTFPSGATAVQKVAVACDKIKATIPAIKCSPNFKVKVNVSPNDTHFASMWGLPKIGATSAWNSTTGSSAVKVAIVDTGVDMDHVDLAGNLSRNLSETANGIDDDANGCVDDLYGCDFSNGDGNPEDDQGHGTHVAGTIGASGNNAVGVTGVNWTVGLIPVKALDAEGSGFTSDIADAIRYSVDRGAHVINMSLGGGGGTTGDVMYEAISYANTHGVLVVAAAGNEAANNDAVGSFPANYALPNIIAVASTQQNETLSSFSNYGATKVHMAAPGTNILSTYFGNQLGYLSGTSMATPHVAGAAALVKAAKMTLTASQIRSILLNNVDVLASLSGKVTTSGRLNVDRAVTAALQGSDTPAPDPTPDPDEGDDGDDGSDNPGSDPGDEPFEDFAVLDPRGKIDASRKNVAVSGDLYYEYSGEGIEDVRIQVKCKDARNATAKSRLDGTFAVKLKLKKSRLTKVTCEATAIGLDLKEKFTVRASKSRRR